MQMQMEVDLLGPPLTQTGYWSVQAVAADIEAGWHDLHVCQSQVGTAGPKAVGTGPVPGLRDLHSWQQMGHLTEVLMSQSLLWVSPWPASQYTAMSTSGI